MVEINLLRFRSKQKKSRRFLLLFFCISLLGFLGSQKKIVWSHSIVTAPVFLTPAIADTLSWGQLQFVGYLEENAIFKAFLQLPTGELKEISKGAYVGKEHARVIELNKQNILIEVDGVSFIKKYAL